MSSIMRWRNGLMGLSGITKAPVSHGVEPHDLETGLRLSRASSLLQTIQPSLAAPTARAVSFKGGKRAYEGCLGKDRSPRHSRRSIASAKYRVHSPGQTFL